MNNLMPLDMYAAIGGGTSSFQQHQLIQSAPSLRHYDPQPYLESHLIPNCIGHPRIRNPNHRTCDNSVQGALYCQSGAYLEILDQETAEADAIKHSYSRPQYIRGSKTDRFNSYQSQQGFAVIAVVVVVIVDISLLAVAIVFWLLFSRSLEAVD
ncbi:unnamed protein product [Enterobius vermicularis]|uniref:Membrane protein UL56 n=1 Tax=Enterobius vermicularis TaxID=51028 RepID=A0A0N4VD67_ENTVE|nr:unnamed protein product [Enterobius vermicularis]